MKKSCVPDIGSVSTLFDSVYIMENLKKEARSI